MKLDQSIFVNSIQYQRAAKENFWVLLKVTGNHPSKLFYMSLHNRNDKIS